MVTRAIPIFEKTHPGSIAVFAFDNSSSHKKFADDALNVANMNLNPGGKQANIRDTIFNGEIQSMNFSEDYPVLELRGKPKGIKIILQERGLWPEQGLRYKCGGPDGSNTDCCATHLLASQPDFLNQKPLLQEIIESHGHKVIFYPKFHCELNYIEMYWGAAKRYAREHCDYTWSGLLKTVPIALDSVPLNQIRKFSRKSMRYI